MSKKKVSMVFELESNAFNKQLKNTNDSIKLTTQQLKTADAEMNKYGNNIKTLGEKQKLYEKQILQTRDKLNLYSNKIVELNSTLKANKNELKILEEQKKSLNKQYKEAVDSMGAEAESTKKLKEELDSVSKAYNDKKKSIENNTNTFNKYNVELEKAQTQLTYLEGDLQNCTKAIEEQSNKFRAASESLQQSGEKLKSIGENISGVGDKITKLSLPLAGATIALGTFAMNFETAIARINTLLDDDTNLDSYKEKIIEISNETGLSLDVVSAGMYQVISALGDGGKETEGYLDIIAKSAKAAGVDVEQMTTLIASGMKGYGEVSEESAEKISNLTFLTAKLGQTTVPELVSSMGSLFPIASSIGISMEELYASMATTAGVTGSTSEAATQLKALMQGLISPTETMAELMDKYGYANGQAMVEAEGLQGVLKILQTETGGQADKMGELFSSSEALITALALTGGSYQDFIGKNSAMQNSLGATDEALKKVSGTNADKLSVKINKLKNSFLEAGEELAPFIDGLTDGITSITNVIKKLDPAMIATIGKFSLFSTGIGLVTKASGGFISGIGSMTKGLSGILGKLASTSTATSALGTAASTVAKGGISTLIGGLGGLSGIIAPVGIALAGVGTAMYVAKESTDFFNSSILKTEESMSIVEKVIANFTGATTYTRKELEELGYVFEEFEGITPEVAEGLELVAEKTRSLNLAIEQVNFDGAITEDEIKSIEKKTEDWCTTIIETIKNNESEVNKAVEDLFGADGVITESEQQVLNILNKNNQEKVKVVEDANKRINEIVALAGEENRALTEKELGDIQIQTNKANKALLDSYNLTYEERMAAQNLFFQEANTQSAESLQVELQQERKAVEERKAVVAEKYNAGIEALKASIPQLEGAERELAEAELKAQIEQRDLLIENEEQKWQDIIGAVEEKYPAYMEVINKYNGELLTQKDLETNKELEKMKEKYEKLDGITESGLYKVWDKTKQQYDNVRVVVDENTKEVIGIHSDLYNETAGYTEEIRKDLAKTASEYNFKLANIKNDLRNWSVATVNSNGEVIDNNNQVIGTIKEMEEEIKKTTGKNIKIKVDNGVITNLDSIIGKLDWINRVRINPKYVDVTYRTSGGNTLKPYATGGITNQPTLALTQERGLELIDTISTYSSNAIQTLNGEISQLPSNTKITNALMTTAKMNSEINYKVNYSLVNALDKTVKNIIKEINKRGRGNISYNIDVHDINDLNAVSKFLDKYMENYDRYNNKNMKRYLNQLGVKTR